MVALAMELAGIVAHVNPRPMWFATKATGFGLLVSILLAYLECLLSGISHVPASVTN
jgi:hypothetical protein